MSKATHYAAKAAREIDRYKRDHSNLTPLQRQRRTEKINKFLKLADRHTNPNKPAKVQGKKLWYWVDTTTGKLVISENHVTTKRHLLRCDGQTLSKREYPKVFKQCKYKYTVRYVPYKFHLLNLLGLSKRNPEWKRGTFNLPNAGAKL